MTLYLGRVPNLDLTICDCVKVKYLWLVFRFSVEKVEQRKPAVAEHSFGFFSSGNRHKRE